jgi:leucine-rich repeat protein SHOC2
METAELEQIIEQARLDRVDKLDLSSNQLTYLPESIGNLTNLTWLKLGGNTYDRDELGSRTDESDWALFNKIKILPESISNLTQLTSLNLGSNQLTTLPESIGNLTELTSLNVSSNHLTTLPDSLGNLTKLTSLNLSENYLDEIPQTIGNLINLIRANFSDNQINILPERIINLSQLTSLDLSDNKLCVLPQEIGNLSKLIYLYLGNNQLSFLPESIGNISGIEHLTLDDNQIDTLPSSIGNLSKLKYLSLQNNPLTDLSSIQNLRNLQNVRFLGVCLPYRYRTNFCKWKSEWLLDEDNVEIRRALIAQLGYEKLCSELNAIEIDSWREYSLLKINKVEKIYNRKNKCIATEAMVLLKMTCPSTAHIHILRVPPKMTSAEAAITWINQGIHPDSFNVQT